MPPRRWRVIFARVFCVFDRLSQAAQIDKYFVAEKNWHSAIFCSVEYQERCLDSIQIEDGGVLNISITKLPRSPAHRTRSSFGDRDTKSAALRRHSSIEP